MDLSLSSTLVALRPELPLAQKREKHHNKHIVLVFEKTAILTLEFWTENDEAFIFIKTK